MKVGSGISPPIPSSQLPDVRRAVPAPVQAGNQPRLPAAVTSLAEQDTQPAERPSPTLRRLGHAGGAVRGALWLYELTEQPNAMGTGRNIDLRV